MDQIRERIRNLHYSLSTEKVNLYWVRFYILWHTNSGQMRHPRDVSVLEAEAFRLVDLQKARLPLDCRAANSSHGAAALALLICG